MTKPGSQTPESGQPPNSNKNFLPLGGRAVANSRVDATPAAFDLDAETLVSKGLTLAGSEIMNTLVVVYPRPTLRNLLLIGGVSLAAGAFGAFAGRISYDVLENTERYPMLIDWLRSFF